MKQGTDVEDLVRQRIRGLRLARGWSLDELAARCLLSPSTLSRIETGHRRIALDQLTAIARALDTTLDQLVESGSDDDVVIRPHCNPERGTTTWLLSRDSRQTVAKILVRKNEAAEFSTMVPHAFGAYGGPAEILGILDHEGERTHLPLEGQTGTDPVDPSTGP